MRLRELQLKDAPYMLKWMHDEEIVHYLRKDFAKKTLDDCRDFILQTQGDADSICLAIVNDHDEYLGTVSLKHINNCSAELGIVIRRCAMGKGYAAYALQESFEYGLRKRGINYIFWCVDPENKRAIHFYAKNGYQRCDVPDHAYDYTPEEKQRFIWYSYRR